MTKSSFAFVYNVGMYVIYLDSLFAVNLLTDYLICLLTMRICSLPLRRGRCLCAALIGALYAVSVYLPGCIFLRGGIFKAAFGVLMSSVCFAGEAHFLRCTAVFFAVSAAFGGAVHALSGGYLDTRVLIVCFVIIYIILIRLFRDRAAAAERKLCRVRITFLGQSAEFSALLDTGNSLRDSISGKKVMLMSLRAARELLPELASLPFDDGVSLVENFFSNPSLRGRFRLIPCRTASGTTLLPLFSPDSISVDDAEKPLLAAISPYIDDTDFDAII